MLWDRRQKWAVCQLFVRVRFTLVDIVCRSRRKCEEKTDPMLCHVRMHDMSGLLFPLESGRLANYTKSYGSQSRDTRCRVACNDLKPPNFFLHADRTDLSSTLSGSVEAFGFEGGFWHRPSSGRGWGRRLVYERRSGTFSRTRSMCRAVQLRPWGERSVHCDHDSKQV